jgi:alpha-glucosidase
MDKGVDAVKPWLPPGHGSISATTSPTPARGGIAAPYQGLPPMLARQGSGVFLDLAAGGYQPGAPQPGVLLYPPQGAGAMVWTGFDEAPAMEAAPGPTRASAAVAGGNRRRSRRAGDHCRWKAPIRRPRPACAWCCRWPSAAPSR